MPADAAWPYVNRDIAWLEFNRRVLHEALDSRTPLLERVRFLGIVGSNLNEFFMKRVGGIKQRMRARLPLRPHETLSYADQLLEVRRAAQALISDQASAFGSMIFPELREHGIDLVKVEDLSETERLEIGAYYRANLFPVLTPLAVDPGHPFPFISNQSTSLGLSIDTELPGQRLFARVKIPRILPQWIRVGSKMRFVSLIDIICHHLDTLFPGMTVRSVMPFHILRNIDIDHDGDDHEDLLEGIEEELRERRFSEVVRLLHGPAPDPWILAVLMTELKLDPEDIYSGGPLLDYTDLKPIWDLNIPALKYPTHGPVVPVGLSEEEGSLFSVVRRKDLLFHFPYESFSATVERFIRSAAEDSKVVAIKMTLYRTGEESPFIHALMRAAESGKQVVCLIELKARFDEARNIFWAQELEKAGVHVVYGVVGLKTHAKLALVVRQEPDGLRSYAYIGTGNFHVETAKHYTDLALITCRSEITEEVVELFNFLTGRSLKRDYQTLLVAPFTMKDRFIAMIEREAEHQAAGRPAQIIAKMNNLEDHDIGRALMAASDAEVPIDLIVRGFCTLRPNVAGKSEHIRVTSIIGRFLEHARLYYFRNGSANPVDGEFYIGSADWMYRNLHARVEVVTPVLDRDHRDCLWESIQVELRDQRQTWEMHADGGYHQRTPQLSGEELSAQEILATLARARVVPK